MELFSRFHFIIVKQHVINLKYYVLINLDIEAMTRAVTQIQDSILDFIFVLASNFIFLAKIVNCAD
jgi:hypothetical protein